MASALYSKVENISEEQIYYNQDKRALHDRWKQPGDKAKFKSIKDTSPTPMSSVSCGRKTRSPVNPFPWDTNLLPRG